VDRRRWTLILGLGLWASCARPLYAPDHLEPFWIDKVASEVEVENSEEADRVFEWCSEAIEALFDGMPAATRPARFRAKVRLDHSLLRGILGDPEATAEVELTLEVGGRQARGRGTGPAPGSFPRNGYWDQPLERAVRDATQAALLDAARALAR